MVKRVRARNVEANSLTLSRLVRSGTAGQVLTSAGAGADPSFQDLPTITPVAVLPRGYIDGLVLSRNASTPSTRIDVAAGVCRDAADTTGLSLSGTAVKQVNLYFQEAATAGALATSTGGLDATDDILGVKWFHAFLIGGAGKVTQPFFSTKLTPTLPSGFTTFRRIGAVLWDNASGVVPFTQFSDEFLFAAPRYDFNDLLPPSTDAGRLVVTSTPLGVKTRGLYIVGMFGAQHGVALTSPDEADTQVAAQSNPLTAGRTVSILSNTSQTAFGAPHWPVRTDTASRVRMRTSNGGGQAAFLLTRGWIDPRGKDQ